jgi:HEPN domain-containing protein
VGEKNRVKYCLDEARSLADDGHYGAALIYLVQAAEIAAKEFLQSRKGIRVPYFSACIPHLKEMGAIAEKDELTLRRINTKRNLVIHSGVLILEKEYEDARKSILKLIEKL